jgi:CheY-like chemotaxis protein
MKVLVVEFEHTLREFIAMSLRERRYDVLTAAAAKEALRLYRKNAGIHLVLTGLYLDGKTSGVQLMRRIRAINSEQPCGLISIEPALVTPFNRTQLYDFMERLVVEAKESPGHASPKG